MQPAPDRGQSTGPVGLLRALTCCPPVLLWPPSPCLHGRVCCGQDGAPRSPPPAARAGSASPRLLHLPQNREHGLPLSCPGPPAPCDRTSWPGSRRGRSEEARTAAARPLRCGWTRGAGCFPDDAALSQAKHSASSSG